MFLLPVSYTNGFHGNFDIKLELGGDGYPT